MVNNHITSCNKKYTNSEYDPIADLRDKCKDIKEKPLAVTCYICGGDYFVPSFKFHLESCRKKWVEQEERKVQEDRRKLPEPPKLLSTLMKSSSQAEIPSPDIFKKYNEEANDVYTSRSLAHCDGCKRHFNDASLRIHRKGCPKSKGYVGDKRFKPYGEFELPERPKLKHVGDPI